MRAIGNYIANEGLGFGPAMWAAGASPAAVAEFIEAQPGPSAPSATGTGWKHDLKKALPWIIGGGALLFLVGGVAIFKKRRR